MPHRTDGVDHPARRQFKTRGDSGFSGWTTTDLPARFHQPGTGRPVDRSVYAAAAAQRIVCGIHHGLDLEGGNIPLYDFDHGQPDLGSSAFYNLTAILVACGITWCWYDNMRARETAIAHVRSFCHKQDYQFLDGSVCLRTMLFSFAHWRLRRHYDFYYTRDNHERRRGTVILLGHEVEHFLINEDAVAM